MVSSNDLVVMEGGGAFLIDTLWSKKISKMGRATTESIAWKHFYIFAQIGFWNKMALSTFITPVENTRQTVLLFACPRKNISGWFFFRSVGSKSLSYTAQASIDEWSASVGKVLSKHPDIQLVLPSHGDWRYRLVAPY